MRSLGHVHRVVERRNTIPILANVLIRADKSALSLKATDLDLEVIESIAAEVSPEASVARTARLAASSESLLPCGPVARRRTVRAIRIASRPFP